MAHIPLPPGLPGIVGPIAGFPDTGAPLGALAQALLRGPSSLTPAERELIATVVSRRNQCVFCTGAHAAAARHLLGDEGAVVDQVLADPDAAPVSGKLRALLHIAGLVQTDGRLVQAADVEAARAQGADDRAIHDTVLIAAAFCMFNRYVDGLGTWTPTDPAAYAQMGAELATRGYGAPAPLAEASAAHA